MKKSSKKEIYRMLQLEGDLYLPPLPQASNNYVEGVISEKVNSAPNNYYNLFSAYRMATSKSFSVSHLPKLRVNDILRFAKSKSKWMVTCQNSRMLAKCMTELGFEFLERPADYYPYSIPLSRRISKHS